MHSAKCLCDRLALRIPPPRRGVTEVRLRGAARARSALPMKQDVARRGWPRLQRPPRAADFPGSALRGAP
eukprot:3449587-Alexandrium_andersonii.AAC.1